MIRISACLLSCVFVLGQVAVAPSGWAQEASTNDPWLGAGSLLLHGRIIASLPYNQHTTLDVIGGKIDSQPRILPDFDLTYFLTDHLAISGEGGILRTKITATDTLIGDLPIGTVWSASVITTAQWHFLPHEKINPYVGAGVSASWYFGEKPAGGYVTSFKVDPQVAPVLQAGIDYHLSGNWYGNIDFKQIFMPDQKISSGTGPGAKVGLDVLVVGMGVGYRF